MANNWAFATLAELKQRIGISAADTTDDDLLTSLLDLTAGAIESAAGRPLRRCHVRTEYFTGGSSVIQLDAYPIAKLHSVRESLTRDFETAGEYEELVEGTDFVVDPGPGGRYGETGQLRRIGGRWAGSKVSPACVRVVYTGGYKTDEEVAAENTTVDITGSVDVQDFCLVTYGDSYDTDAAAEPLILFDNLGHWAICCISLKRHIVPTWNLREAVFNFGAYGTGDVAVYLFLPASINVARARASAIGPAMAAALSCGGSGLSAELAMHDVVFGPDKSAAWEQASADAFLLGRMDFMIYSPDGYGMFATIEHATASLRPYVRLTHYVSVDDPYTTPDDLRNANLLQAVHEYMTRRSPGMISQATRGTMMPSGSSYLKTAADLLPEVQRIALGYRRMF